MDHHKQFNGQDIRSRMRVPAHARSSHPVTSVSAVSKPSKKQSKLRRIQRRVLSRVRRQYRSAVRWWRRKDSRYGWSWRIANALVALLVLASVCIPVWMERSGEASYDLKHAASLLTPTPASLAQKIQYNPKQQMWQFNQDAANQLPGVSGDAAKIGGVTYSAELPSRFTKASKVKLTDAQAKLDMGMAPQFALQEGKRSDGYIVYPLQSGRGQLIYTFNHEGVKEDIVLYQAPGDKAAYSYKLNLPAGLEARLQNDGSVGIFGGDKSLFGNISYGTDKDRDLVEKARANSSKNTLYYVIPAPTIVGDTTHQVHTEFNLEKDILTVKVSGLKHAKYPLSIDPSFVMDTSGSCSWQKAGNNEGNVDYSGCQLTRRGVGGGTVGTWNFTDNSQNRGATQNGGSGSANGMITSRNGFPVVVSDGFMYALGGGITSGNRTNLVEYAAINSNGTLGTWQATTSLPEIRSDHAAVVYDGFIYFSGGYTGGSNFSPDVKYAAVCTGKNVTVQFGASSTAFDAGSDCDASSTPGTLSAWRVTASMATARTNHAMVAYNNRMYIIDGCTRTAGQCNTGNPTANVYCADISGDGMIDSGSWGTCNTTGLSARDGLGATVYNGYIYVAGGCVTYSLAACTSMPTTVQYAKIGSDGSLGDWTTTSTSFTGARDTVRMLARNGYIYLIGGGASNYTSDVQLAMVYANGDVGPWKATTSFNIARSSAAFGFYGDYFYVLGGCSAFAANCTTLKNDVQFSAVTTNPGGISPFTTETDQIGTTNDGIRRAASVVYGGYIYLVGGITIAGNNRSAKTYFAKLNADGSTGAWTIAANDFTDGRSGAAAVAYNGYLYVMGGETAGTITTNCPQSGTSGQCKDIQKAPINGTTGDLGGWSSAGSFYGGSSTGRDGLGAAVYNGYIYVMGGEPGNSGPVAQVDVGQIDTSTGNITSWTNNTTGLGSNTRSYFGITQHGSHLYLVGGKDSGSSIAATVVMATLSDGGGISAFSSAGSDFTTARFGSTAQVYNNYLYVIGGRTSISNGAVGSNNVQYIKLNNDGTLSGSWNAAAATFTTSRVDSSTAMYNGFVYVMGGCTNIDLIGGCGSSSNNLKDLQYAQAYNGGGGSDGAWVTGPTSSTITRYAPMTVASSGYLIVMGGCTTIIAGNCTAIANSSTYAPINSDASLGSWTAGTILPINLDSAGVTTANGYVYLVGGCSAGGCSTVQNTVYSALICTGSNNGVDGCGATGGTLGTWHPLNIISARWGTAAVAVNGYLYAAGGINGSGTNLNDVQSAQILPTGGLGSWGSVGSGATFTTARGGHSLVRYGDYLYILGGTTGTGGLSDVQMAQVQSGGQLGSWSSTTSMPAASLLGIAAAANGYMYYSGTRNSAATNQTMYAPIYSNGTLGRWTSTYGNSGTTAVSGFAGAIYNGYLYRAGGFDLVTSISNASYYAPLLTIPQIARHSILLTTDARTAPANFFATIAPQSKGSSVSVSPFTANDSGGTPAVLNSLTANLGIVSGTKYSITTGNDGTKYYWLQIALDDSQSMTWGEAGASSMSYLQLNYHANPGKRLRGGKTFNSGSQQSLDAY